MASPNTEDIPVTIIGSDDEREALLQPEEATDTATSSSSAGNLNVESPLQAPFQALGEKIGSGLGSVDLLATLSLLAVAVIWGTYSPVLRYLYQLDGPPTAAVLTGIRGTFQALILLLPGFLIGVKSTGGVTGSEGAEDEDEGGGGWALWKAGFELGIWNFAGTALQAVGLEHTTAARAAFLVQATAIMTPLLETASGGRLSRSTWISSGLALAGSIVISSSGDGTSVDAAAAPGLEMIGGDGAILLAAFFYSLMTLRLSTHARKYRPIQLAAAKCTGLAVIALGWMGIDVARRLSLGESWGWDGVGSTLAWSLLLWTAVSGATSAFLQTNAQSRVSASQAQVLFATTPLWSAALALVILPSEHLTIQEGAGGLLIVAATLLVTRI